MDTSRRAHAHYFKFLKCNVVISINQIFISTVAYWKWDLFKDIIIKDKQSMSRSSK